MIDTTRRHRPAAALAGLTVLVVLAALLFGAPSGASATPKKPSTAAGHAAAKPTPGHRGAPRSTARVGAKAAVRARAKTGVKAAAVTSLPSDESGGLPRVAHNETVGDFLGLGYEQRAVAENGYLTIYNPPARGGNVLRSTPTDLVAPGDVTIGTSGVPAALWNPYAKSFAVANKLAALYLAWSPSGFYLAGARNTGGALNLTAVDPYYYVQLYKLPADGSCASAACATWVNPLQWYCSIGVGPSVAAVPMGVTALAVGNVAGQEYVAIGMSNSGCSLRGTKLPGGVLVVPGTGNTPTPPYFDGFNQVSAFGDTVTGIAWDPNGSGRLGVATASPNYRSINSVTFSPGSGFADPHYTYWDQPWDGKTYDIYYAAAALSVAAAERPDGSTVFAYGMADGSVKLFDPSVTSGTLLATSATSSNPVDAVSFADRIDGTSGLPDIVAVSSTGNAGQVLRYSSATTLTPQPVAASGGTTTDVGSIESWYPGYKAGSLKIINGLTEPINVAFASRPNASYGCWFAPAFPDRSAFPLSSSITVDASTGPNPNSPTFTIGGYTAGSGGACAATDFTGQWAAYLVVSPVQRPADETVVKLVLTRGGRLLATPVGGSLQLDVALLASDHALGSWGVRVRGAVRPGPPLYSLTGSQLDPAGTDRPVYRFDVSASTFALPISTPPRISAIVPPFTVRGYTDAGSWLDLGLLIPQGQPTRATNGSLTLAPGSFYWRNPSTGPQVILIEVSNGARMQQLYLNQIAPPSAATTVGQVVVCPASGSASCDANANPFANGLDQAPLRIQIYDDLNNVLPPSDPNYGRVYYTDENGDLVTSLAPADGSDYIRVSPYPGEYSNDASAGSIVRPSPTAPVGGRFGYVSTNSTDFQTLTAHAGGTSSAGDAVKVQATQFSPQVPTGQKAANGFYVTGCSDFSGNNDCRLAAPSATKPALFLTSDVTTGSPLIGLMLRTVGSSAQSSLPLQQLANQPEHTVASSTLSINNGEVTMDNTSGFQPADAIDAYLVSHGTRVKAQSVGVGGGN